MAATTTATSSQAQTQSNTDDSESKKPDIDAHTKHTEFTKSVSVAEAVRDLVSDVQNTEREQELERILKSYRINPIQILQLSVELDEADIKKQYRRLSMLVHPDRCPEHLKERAHRAFTMLNNCKKDLESPEFVVKLKHQINEARRRVIESKMIKKGQAFVSDATAASDDCATEPPTKKQKLDPECQPATHAASHTQTEIDKDKNQAPSEQEIKVQLMGILKDCAWQKHIHDQASQKLEQQTLAKREELKARIAAERQYKKEWEEGRSNRVSNWRDWQNNKKPKKKKKDKKKSQ